MDRKIFQEQYDFELNQRNHLASSVNVPIMAATIVGGAISSMLLAFPYKIDSISIIFTLTSMLSIAFLVVSIYLIFRSFIGYEYKKLPPPSGLNEHYNELVLWHKENDNTSENAKVDFDDYLYERMGQAVEVNSDNNIARGNYLHMATISIAVATIFVALSSGLYVYGKLNGDTTPHKIEVIGTVNVK